jgi:hypothetical protein
MSKSLKLTLDILIGAAIPILVLKYGTEPLGALRAYITAAMIPVVWVLLDLLVITRRFNFITAFVGLTSLMRGALAFWYVDGLLFAVKDSVSYVVSFLVFGVTALLGSPVTRAIALQGLSPDTPEREQQMNRLLDEPTVGSAMKKAGILIGVTNLAAGAINFVINYRMVLAPFNTPAFNDQVANVNAITRFVLVLPDMVAIFFAFSMMYKAMYALLPANEGTDPDAGEFWTLLARREDALALAAAAGEPSDAAHAAALAAEDVRSRAARQAREEFGLS